MGGVSQRAWMTPRAQHSPQGPPQGKKSQPGQHGLNAEGRRVAQEGASLRCPPYHPFPHADLLARQHPPRPLMHLWSR